MKFTVSADHREYYLKHQALELEDLLTEAQFKQLQDGVTSLFSPKIPPEQQYILGRDLWRQHASIRKIVTHIRLATLVSELTDHKTLRLGFDSYIPIPSLYPVPDPYYQLLREPRPLASHCSLQGIVCGLMLCLKGSGENQEKVTAFSHKPGHGVFLNPDYPIEYPELAHRRDHAYLLIVYTVPNAVYIRQEDDPNALAFKSVGYTIGDKLKDKWNPIIIRS